VDIAAWLRDLGLERYEEAFRESAIDAEVLPELTDADLEKLGVLLGHRKRLLKAIAALRAGDTAPAALVKAAERSDRETGRAIEAERRQLTVLFCDLVGSTELSTKLDPENMREVIRDYQNAVVGETTHFEGHVAKFMGDGVLAYFGWPQAHEDDVERAVRAALAIAHAVSQVTSPVGEPLAARIGIATGPVVVGDLLGEGAAQEQAVVGETPNLAARLQEVAEPGMVVIAATTRHLLGSLFELENLGAQRVKGFAEPLAAFRILGEGRAESRFEAMHTTGLTPLVGREHELAILLERWVWAKDSDGQVVLLAGEPGIGKSRLARALRERLAAEPYTPISHFCSPYHTSSALYPVTGLLERAAGFTQEDTADERLDRLEALLARSTDRLHEAVPLVAALLSIPTGERYPPLELSPQRQKQRTLEVLLDQLSGLAAKQPVLAVYEDLHWVDPTTRELLDLLVEQVRHLPVLMLMTFRPEFNPPWTGQAHVTLLPLSRLGRRQGAAIVERLTGGKALPDEVLDQIVSKTDGVPLFVEELTKTVLESGLLRDAGDHFEVAGQLPPLAIPATLHDSLMARLDRLAPAKHVAQIGAVIGREFGHDLVGAVAQLSESQLTAALDQLVQAELVFRRGTPPDATYSFKHALVQETAYQSLLKSRRQQLHARIADALSQFGTTPEVLARHYTEAGLLEPAARSWAEAGHKALARSAMHEGARAFRNALGLLRRQPPSAKSERQELDLLVPLSVSLINTTGPGSADVEAVQREAAGLGDREGEFRARWLLWRVHNVRAELEQAVGIARGLRDETRRDGDPDRELHALHALWSSSLFRGDLEATVRHVETALELYDPARHSTSAMVLGGHDPKECGLTNGGNALFLLGYPERALTWNRAGMAHALELGQPQIVVHALNWNIILPQLLDDLDDIRGAPAGHGCATHRGPRARNVLRRGAHPRSLAGRPVRCGSARGRGDAGASRAPDGDGDHLRTNLLLHADSWRVAPGR
jgi:class 3 adenylate cyclase